MRSATQIGEVPRDRGIHRHGPATGDGTEPTLPDVWASAACAAVVDGRDPLSIALMSDPPVERAGPSSRTWGFAGTRAGRAEPSGTAGLGMPTPPRARPRSKAPQDGLAQALEPERPESVGKNTLQTRQDPRGLTTSLGIQEPISHLLHALPWASTRDAKLAPRASLCEARWSGSLCEASTHRSKAAR
jgi:hypothetical protein